MRRVALTVVASLVLAALAACGESGSTEPAVLQRQDEGGAGGDSTSRPLPASVDASGQVVAVEFVAPPGVNGDTLKRTPVPGAAVALWRNRIVNGAATQELVRETATDAAGGWRFDDIAGGHYVLKVTPPAGSDLRPATHYLAATSETVVLLVHLWRP